jgi:hypothetical protein
MTPGLNPRSAEIGLPDPASLDALYLRVANALELSAALAEDHAERMSRNGQDYLAGVELERAERARAAAERGRALVSRLRRSDQP